MTAVDEIRDYLTLPNHDDRCLCGLFGLPNSLRRVVDRDGSEHEAIRCQPARESLRGTR